MDKVCPLCNKLEDVNKECAECGSIMDNLGRVQDFSDPYGPEQPIRDADDYCAHLFICKSCNSKERVKIGKIEI